MHLIYKVTNKTNGKIYIGQTNNLDRRMSEHFNSKSKTKFSRAISKYGKDCFEVEVLETNLTKEQANERERFLISYYNSVELGYNITNGGEGGNGNLKKINVYDLNGKYLISFPSLSKAIEILNLECSTSEISRACKKETYSHGYYFRYAKNDNVSDLVLPSKINKRAKAIVMCDLTGKDIKTYSSIADVCKDGFSRSSVIACLKGRYKQSGGYVWRYADNKLVTVRNLRPHGVAVTNVYQIDNNGKVVGKFNNCREACEVNGFNCYKHICSVINHEYKTAYGFKWIRC